MSKQHLGKKGLTLLLALAMLMAWLPSFALTVNAAPDPPSDRLRTAAAAGGEYALDCDIKDGDKLITQLDVSENFTLDLNGYTLEIEVDDNNGIKIASGKTFTIDDSSSPSTGTLTIVNEYNDMMEHRGTGINTSDGTLIINNGLITATANSSLAAAIGGGWTGSGGNIIINGGTVTAFNDNTMGAAIGGGYSGNGGNITINGGTVNAKSKNTPGPHDIGSNIGRDGTTTITGGSVFAANGSINGFGAITLYPVKVTVKQNGSNVDGAAVTHETYTGAVTTGGNLTSEFDYTTPTKDSGVAWLWLPSGETAISASKNGTSESAEYIVTASVTENAVTIDLMPSQSISITGTPSTVIYGDMFTLGTSGGNGTGAVSYTVESGNATVNSSTGEVITTGTGSVTISATKAADGTYSEATATTTFTVAPKQLTWSNGTVNDKTYDGNKAATIETAPTLIGVINNDDVTAIVGTVAFAHADAGMHTVIASNYGIGGTDVAKYIVPTSQPAFAKASITSAVAPTSPKSEKETPDDSTPTSPDTGDNTPIILLVLVLLSSGTLIVLFKKKKFRLRKTAK